MIFARYKGAATEGFTPGRTYVARPEMDGSSVVGFEFLEMRDDSDRLQRVWPEKGQFEYLEEVYVVALRKTELAEAGEVLVADDAEDTPTQRKLKVNGEGMVDARDFVVLDGTNVAPRIVVCDRSDGAWVKVARTDEALWLMTDIDERFRSPEEFLFPVSAPAEGGPGELMYEPMVVCVMATGEADLTAGRRYRLVRTRQDGLWAVRNDAGEEKAYLAGRFRMG